MSVSTEVRTSLARYWTYQNWSSASVGSTNWSKIASDAAGCSKQRKRVVQRKRFLSNECRIQRSRQRGQPVDGEHIIRRTRAAGDLHLQLPTGKLLKVVANCEVLRNLRRVPQCPH